MNPSDTAAPATSAIGSCRHPAAHSGHTPAKPPGTPPVPCSPGSHGTAAQIRHARRARREVRLPAGAFRAVQVVLYPLRRRGRDPSRSSHRETPRSAASARSAPTPACALGIMVLGPVRDLPRHRRARTARLFPPLLFLLRPLSGAPLLPGRPPPRQVIQLGGIASLRCSATPDRSAAASRSREDQRPLPPAPRSCPPAPGSTHSTRIRGRLLRRHIGHGPE